MGAFPDSHFPSALFFEEKQRGKTHKGEYNGNPLGLTADIGIHYQYEPGDPEEKDQK
jgi:hypothetical protein